MPRIWPRETLIALRARRTAHQIASDIINPHMEISAVPCCHCGQEIRLPADHLHPLIKCPACGHSTPLPSNFITDSDIYFSQQDLAERREYLACQAARPHIRRSSVMRWITCIVVGLMIAMMLLGLVTAFQK